MRAYVNRLAGAVRRAARPSANDAIELGGVVLLAWALSWAHVALAPAVLGLYALVLANVRGTR